MKGQYNAINIGGTAVSAALLVSTQFSAVRTLFIRAISRVINVDVQQLVEAESCSISATPQVPDAAATIEGSQEYNLIEEILTKTQLQMETIDVDALKQNDLEVSSETSYITQNEINEVKSEENTLPNETSTINQNTLPDENPINQTTCSNENTKSNIEEPTTTENQTIDSPIASEETNITEKEAQTQPPEEHTTQPNQTETSNQETTETQLTNDACPETPKKHRKPKTYKTHTEIPEKLTENPQLTPNVNAGLQEFESLMKIAEANAKTEYNLTEERQDTWTAKSAPQEPLPSPTNGCPKNLAYYNQTPKPKETPNECFSCSRLIACVCRTSN
jgi:hypothetical protein